MIAVSISGQVLANGPTHDLASVAIRIPIGNPLQFLAFINAQPSGGLYGKSLGFCGNLLHGAPRLMLKISLVKSFF